MNDHPTAPAVDGISVCVCSARPEAVIGNLEKWTSALGAEDELVIVLDTDGDTSTVTAGHGAANVRPIWLGSHQGLAAARTAALRASDKRFVMFLDDDALCPRPTLTAIRRALADGAQTVGVKLVADFGRRSRPRYLPEGLWHYVGVHTEATLGSVWGACFAIDRDFVRTQRLEFAPELSRHGRELRSGDDTSFVRNIRGHGGQVVFLRDVHAVHQIRPEKCSLRYLLRRAWWQGRSETRRGEAIAGLRKELRRLATSRTFAARATGLIVFGSAIVAGIVSESVNRVAQRRRSAASPASRRSHGTGVYAGGVAQPDQAFVTVGAGDEAR